MLIIALCYVVAAVYCQIVYVVMNRICPVLEFIYLAHASSKMYTKIAAKT